MGKQANIAFADIVNKIQHIPFKQAVIELVELSPDYITCIPSSSTGKYHPADEINESGMVLHVGRCSAIAEEMLRMDSEDNSAEYKYYIDILHAACVLHDIFKNGVVSTKTNNDGIKLSKSKYTAKNHPALIYKLICEYEEKVTNEEVKERIRALAILCLFHEGRWTTEPSKQLCNKKWLTKATVYLSKMMHLVDYIASRRTMADAFQYTNKQETDKELT